MFPFFLTVSLKGKDRLMVDRDHRQRTITADDMTTVVQCDVHDNNMIDSVTAMTSNPELDREEEEEEFQFIEEENGVSVENDASVGVASDDADGAAWDVSLANLTMDRLSVQGAIAVKNFAELNPLDLEEQDLSMQEYTSTSTEQLQNVFQNLDQEVLESSAVDANVTEVNSFDREKRWFVSEEEETYSLLEHFDATFAPPSDFIKGNDSALLLHYHDAVVHSSAPFNVTDLANMAKYNNDINFDTNIKGSDIQESKYSSGNENSSVSSSSIDEDENDDTATVEESNVYSELIDGDDYESGTERSYDILVDVKTSLRIDERNYQECFQGTNNEVLCNLVDGDHAENNESDLNKSNSSQGLYLNKSLSTIEGAATLNDAQLQTQQEVIQFDSDFAAKMAMKVNNFHNANKMESNEVEGRMNKLTIQDGPSSIKVSISNDSESDNECESIEENDHKQFLHSPFESKRNSNSCSYQLEGKAAELSIINGPSPIKVSRSNDSESDNEYNNRNEHNHFRRKLCNNSLSDTSLRSEGDMVSSTDVQKNGTSLSLFNVSGPTELKTIQNESDIQENDIIGRNASLWNVSMDGVGSVSMNSSLCDEDKGQLGLPRYYISPSFSPSPYETTLWQSSEVLKRILTFLSLEEVRQVIGVNTFSMRCLASGQLYKTMKIIVRRGKCFTDNCDRAQFWTGLVDTVVHQEYLASLHDKGFPSYQEMLREGEHGKWAAIIDRDVRRAFGTLPPHKTNGTKGHADSIVPYLVQWESPKNNLDTTTNMLALSVPNDKVDMQYCLGNILYALSVRFSTVGYCQGMDYVVANIMRILKDSSVAGDMAWLEEATFNLTSKLFKYYNLQHMYWPELRCLKTCCRVLDKLLLQHLPVLYDHFDHYDLNVGLFALGWFQTLFLYIPSMPSSTVCRVWDIWILERSFKVFFRVAIAILFLSQPVLLNLDAEGMMNYLNTFPDSTLLDKHILIPCALTFKVTSNMLTKIERFLDQNPC